MSSLNTEIKHEENTMQGQSSDEIKNGNEPFETNTLDNTKSSEENTTSEENKYENESSCIVDKLTNITNAINEIVIENDEPVNNNVKNLTQEVHEMNITEKPKPKNGVVLLKETNSSLNCLLAYGSDDEDDDDDEQSVSEEVFNSLSSFDSDGEMEEDDHTT